MIEICWVETSKNIYEQFLNVCRVLSWLSSEILRINEENEMKINFDGMFILKDEEKTRVCSLLICNGESQKRIIEILQHPPEEYQTKYSANVLSEEPNPIKQEQSTNINTQEKTEEAEPDET